MQSHEMANINTIDIAPVKVATAVDQQVRRYDVDWLRNLALMLLILYHLGMYYVADWGWHIKSDQQSVLLQNFMVMSNLWRMCLLFFISGMTLALIDKKYSAGALLRTRSQRLLVPLLFGMAVIVPPQLYYELIEQQQFSGTYAYFWTEYLISDPETDVAPDRYSSIGLWTWNHLWYLIYLFVYTSVFLLLRPLCRKLVASALFKKVSNLKLIFIFASILLVAWVHVRPEFPTTHGLTDDWWSHTKYFLVLLMGYLFASKEAIWQAAIDKRRILLVLGLCTYGLVAMDRNGVFPFMGEAFRNYIAVQYMYGAVIIANLWFWMLGLIGYAGRYLNKPSRLLTYANEAVLPWYIFHQTLIIVIAFNLRRFDLPVAMEALSILVLTVLTCYLLFAVIRHVNFLRFLFGLKLNK
ncbi:MAG: glucan biosynthesis protein C [Glaciecola sp.]|jgi:glucan biosynthesis protein C